MITGKTARGFEYAIPKKRLHNMRLVEVLSKVDTDPTLIPKMLDLLMGQEQKEKMYDFYEDEDGIVLESDITEAVAEIFNAAAVDPDVKN